MQWAKRIGGGSQDFATGHHIDAAGNHVLAGYFTGTMDFDPSAGTTELTSIGQIDGFIAKYTPGGDLLWAKHFGGRANDVVRTSALDPNGNILVSGHFYSTCDFDPGPDTVNLTSVGVSDFFAAKFSPTGDLLWVRAGGSPTLAGSDDSHDIGSDAQGNVFVTGTVTGTAIFRSPTRNDTLLTKGGRDAFLAKYAPNGNQLWVHNFGGTDDDAAGGIAYFPSGDIGYTGYFRGRADFNPGKAPSDTLWLKGAGITAFLARYTTDGNSVWAKAMPCPSGGFILSSALLATSQGDLTLVGHIADTVDFDPGPGVVRHISNGGWDAFFARYSGTGSLAWVKVFGGSGLDLTTSVSPGANESLLIAGIFNSPTMDLDPGAGTGTVAQVGQNDCFFAQYSSSGEFLWGNAIGSNQNDGTTGMLSTPQGNFYLCGFFRNTVDFDPGPGTANLSSAGDTDVFLVNLGDPTATRRRALPGLAVYPNPASGQVLVRVEGNSPSLRASVLSAAGQQLIMQEGQGNTLRLDVSALAPGLYFLEASTPQGRQAIPFAVER